jgi:tetratricopeptide (TPR) repeat protein
VARRATWLQHTRRWCRRHKTVVASAGVCLFVAVMAAALSIGWVSGEQAARVRASDEKVELAFQEAVVLQEQKRWFEARSAIERAQGMLAGGGSTELRERVRRRAADLNMVTILDDIGLDSSTAEKDGKFDIAQRDSAYRQAFRDYGMDLSAASSAQPAEAVAATSIRFELAAALDDWAIVCRNTRRENDTTWRDLLAISRAADPDALRNQVRDALERRDQRALDNLIAAEQAVDLPTSTLLLLVRVARAIRAVEQGGRLAKPSSSAPKSGADMSASPEAIALLRKALRKHPHDFWLNQELAWHLCHTYPPHWDEALLLYSIARALRPQSAGAHVTLSFALLHNGRLEDAIGCCEAAIQLKPDWAAAHNNLGFALHRTGRLPQAVGSYKRAIELNPGLAGAHNNLGLALADQRKLDEAIVCFREAIRLKPDDFRAYYNLGQVLAKRQGDDAFASFRTAIKLESGPAEAYASLGVALCQMGQLPDAITAFQKVVDLQPKDGSAYSKLGSVLMEAGRLKEAIAVHREAIKLAPKFAPAYSNLGAALRRDGQLREAITAYKDAIRVDPVYLNGYSNLAWLLATAPDEKLRDPLRAVAAARKAVELAPKSATCWQRLGVSCYRAGDSKAAVAALQKSIALDGGDSVDWLFLAMAQWQQGDKEEANRAYREVTRTAGKRRRDRTRRVYQPLEEEVRRFRAEAALLLGID